MITAVDELKHVADTLNEQEAEQVLRILRLHARWLFEGEEED